MITFEQFISEASAPSIVAGTPDQAAKTHKAVIRTGDGVIHHHSEKGGVHTIVHSSKSGAMKVSEVHPSSEKNKTSSILTRKATDKEKRMYGGKFIVADQK
jgi:hypothetical protein